MTPHLDPVGLEALFEQVDGWFADLSQHEPISHYARVRKKTSAATKPNSNSTNRKPTLNSLAKDLELLLEESDIEETPLTTKSGPEIFQFNICNNDELALLDDSIGSCYVTYGEIKDEDAMDWTSVSDGGGKEYSVHVNSQDDTGLSDNQDRDSKTFSINSNCENNDLKVQTCMPQDHDYLPKPRAKFSNIDSQYLSSIRSKHTNISVLHSGVIKRFARFNSKFRDLSLRNDRSLVAISNSHNKVGI